MVETSAQSGWLLSRASEVFMRGPLAEHRGRKRFADEYRRISSETLGIAVLGLRWLRRRTERIRTSLKRVATTADPSGQLLYLNVDQLSHGVAALVIAMNERWPPPRSVHPHTCYHFA